LIQTIIENKSIALLTGEKDRSMSDTNIEGRAITMAKESKVSAEARWQIATAGLTGATAAFSKALKDAVGEEKHNEFAKVLWGEAGKGAKEFAASFGLPTTTAGEIEEVTSQLATASMGPEFAFQVVESSDDRCVGRATQCPWRERAKEVGIDWDYCTAGHQSWGDGCVEALNADFHFSLTKNMQRGDPFCEWTIERKK
jgi:hypothetical protein